MENFKEAYLKATGTDPSTIDRSDKKQIKIFLKNLNKHGLTDLFRSAVKEVETPDIGMSAFAGMFPE